MTSPGPIPAGLTPESSALPAGVTVLHIPTTGRHLGILRTVAAALAAQLDFTVDKIEDLCLALDEIATHFILHTEQSSSIRCEFVAEHDSLAVDLQSDEVDLPNTADYSWAILSALVEHLECGYRIVDHITQTYFRCEIKQSLVFSS